MRRMDPQENARPCARAFLLTVAGRPTSSPEHAEGMKGTESPTTARSPNLCTTSASPAPARDIAACGKRILLFGVAFHAAMHDS